MNVLKRSLRSPYLAESVTDSWHGWQTCDDRLAAATREFRLDLARIWCSPWHDVQVGASLFPFMACTPCTLCRYVAEIFSWHVAQVLGMLARLTNDVGSEPFFMSWLP